MPARRAGSGVGLHPGLQRRAVVARQQAGDEPGQRWRRRALQRRDRGAAARALGRGDPVVDEQLARRPGAGGLRRRLGVERHRVGQGGAMQRGPSGAPRRSSVPPSARQAQLDQRAAARLVGPRRGVGHRAGRLRRRRREHVLPGLGQRRRHRTGRCAAWWCRGTGCGRRLPGRDSSPSGNRRRRRARSSPSAARTGRPSPPRS